MNIDKQYLTISNYNRPGARRERTTAVACHYIGNPGTGAQANRNYFENLRISRATKASCHYIIGLNGEIIQLIPEEEISWCTNQANSYTISIEACHPAATGKFTDATYQSYIALAADICKRWGLDPQAGGLGAVQGGCSCGDDAAKVRLVPGRRRLAILLRRHRAVRPQRLVSGRGQVVLVSRRRPDGARRVV